MIEAHSTRDFVVLDKANVYQESPTAVLWYKIAAGRGSTGKVADKCVSNPLPYFQVHMSADIEPFSFSGQASADMNTHTL